MRPKKHRSFTEVAKLVADLREQMKTGPAAKVAGSNLGISHSYAKQLLNGMGYGSMLVTDEERRLIVASRNGGHSA